MSNHTSSAATTQAGDAGGISQLPSTRKDSSANTIDFDAIVALAREAGMLITLDGQIGHEKYESIAGSLTAFRRFINALQGSLTEQLTL